MKVDQPILFEEDIIKKYADSRKALEERDVKDLLRCLSLYINKRLASKEIYALNIPHIGTVYKKFDPNLIEYQEYKRPDYALNDKLFMNFIFKDMSPSNKQETLDYNDKEYIQDFTNYG